MKKYYLVPIIDSEINLNGKSLRNILGASHPELVQREAERIGILYSVSPIVEMPISVKEKYKQHNVETKKMYEDAKVPYYLIAYGNDKCAEEILTKAKITGKYPAALGVRSVSKEKAEEYYAASNYKEKIYSHLNNGQNISDNNSSFSFTDVYEIQGYIEGKIGEQDIKGIFNGKVKIKSLIKK